MTAHCLSDFQRRPAFSLCPLPILRLESVPRRIGFRVCGLYHAPGVSSEPSTADGVSALSHSKPVLPSPFPRIRKTNLRVAPESKIAALSVKLDALYPRLAARDLDQQLKPRD